MEQPISTLYSAIAEMRGMIVFVMSAVILAEYYPYWKRWYHQWQFDRRLARDSLARSEGYVDGESQEPAAVAISLDHMIFTGVIAALYGIGDKWLSRNYPDYSGFSFALFCALIAIFVILAMAYERWRDARDSDRSDFGEAFAYVEPEPSDWDYGTPPASAFSPEVIARVAGKAFLAGLYMCLVALMKSYQ